MNQTIEKEITLRVIDNWLFKRFRGGDAMIILDVSGINNREIQGTLCDFIRKIYRRFDNHPIHNLHIFLPVLPLESIKYILRELYDAVDLARMYEYNLVVEKVIIHSIKIHKSSKNPVTIAMREEFNNVEFKKMKSYLKIDGSESVKFSLSPSNGYNRAMIISYTNSYEYNIPGISIEVQYMNGVSKRMILNEVSCPGELSSILGY